MKDTEIQLTPGSPWVKIENLPTPHVQAILTLVRHGGCASVEDTTSEAVIDRLEIELIARSIEGRF